MPCARRASLSDPYDAISIILSMEGFVRSHLIHVLLILFPALRTPSLDAISNEAPVADRGLARRAAVVAITIAFDAFQWCDDMQFADGVCLAGFVAVDDGEQAEAGSHYSVDSAGDRGPGGVTDGHGLSDEFMGVLFGVTSFVIIHRSTPDLNSP